MKRISILTVSIVSLVLATAYAEEKVKLDGVKCIVAGTKAAKEDNAVDYKGGKVFFCCMNCPKAYAADKAKFATKANFQLVATGQAKQAKCPITGKDLDNSTEITVNGAKIAFCCNMCKGKAEGATGDEQLEMLFSDKAFDKAGFKVPAKKE